MDVIQLRKHEVILNLLFPPVFHNLSGDGDEILGSWDAGIFTVLVGHSISIGRRA
ncbi:hypothetical protein M413DRAFT_151796 [Hebeloma cylindrosporum]|uniref:Uncharacterized protein n=1 Tax=Hebeloma cylindrosporum TaxID=76867 RepID=A0A0C3BYG3_HEBCY|nr:hypothetical protein M413DRAFT_151796 [Hebeloma cylindrosporum h7]